MVTFSSIFVLFLFANSYCLQTEYLSGEWELQEATGKYNNLKATIPGGIYSDLINNNIIGDIFYGYNDTETRWVAKLNWTYKRELVVDAALLSYKNINLVFEGLDTFSTILINNVEIGATHNMFRQYIFNVKNNLQLGNNTIEVRFISPIQMAKTLSSKQGYIVPPECPPGNYRGECHINQIRKMQASFSWDWGPAFPSMGIWKDVYVEAFNSSAIRYLLVAHEEAPGDSWLITISTYLSAQKGETVEGKLEFVLQTDVSKLRELVEVNETNSNDDNEVKVDFSFTIPKLIVRRWWPNGYGEQNLYNLTANFESGSEQDSKTTKIGFRTIELIQEPIGTGSGLSFYFKANGVPIFAKGANEIPLDILPEKGQNPETVSRVLKSAYDTNMNMLRVWGGGVYESDYFYQKTDELGILIWQDFMFACAMYPTYPEFLSNVKEEVRHQVRRLYNHPSIALWAGNNENEVALMTNWYGTNNNFTTYKSDYIKLYIETIRQEFDAIAKNTIFLASSPSNGKKSEEDGFLTTNPQDPLYGDVHFYNYLLDSLNINTYPIPRFASEFGYQSLPDVDTWLTVTANLTDLSPGSPFMDHRQHHPFGLIENNLLISYQLQPCDSFSKNFYKCYIYYSQIVQALSIKYETEYYRSFMGRIDEQKHGNTMGALFWQLNDVWVAPTWSGIDYTGKWKMLQYFARDFFAPTMVTAFLDIQRKLRIYVVSEVASLIGSSLDATVSVDVYNWSSFSVVNSTQINVSLEFGKSLEVAALDTDDFLENLGCGTLPEARKNCFFYLTLLASNAIIAPPNLILATSLKGSNLLNTTVSVVSFQQIDDMGTKFEVTVTSDGISLFVWLDSHGIRGRFSENGFLLITQKKVVIFVSEEPTSALNLKKALTVTHLRDPQYLM